MVSLSSLEWQLFFFLLLLLFFFNTKDEPAAGASLPGKQVSWDQAPRLMSGQAQREERKMDTLLSRTYFPS